MISDRTLAAFHRPARVSPPTGSFGATLTELRRREGCKQTELARSAGLNYSAISRLEGGTRVPERSTVDAIAVSLDLTPADRDRLLHAAGFAPMSAAPLLSCPALAALDEAHRTGSPERKAWIERWIALAVEAA